MAQPCIGIFFLVDDRLLIESTSLDSAGVYGDHRIHERGHDVFFAELLQAGKVKGEYDEYPRGRAAFNSRNGQFTVLADRCILRRSDVMVKLLNRLHLPADVILDVDEHYRCDRCLGRKNER